ncbi:hypothetical protein L1987_63371 [Smallanthus sonchifolius]|uniref:Uncharacterized protein n=1 Tax=Smallanthus sonchifolius TaxID=185202 RepID=A0ACB9CD37_9ASTR|nr:hypothetical protein L1987_63371 [Smallanthus sonchifolius]
MGNCINVMQSSQKNISVLVSNGRVENFKVSTKVRKITSGKYQSYDLVHFDQPNIPLRLNTKLLPAEAYVLIPREDQFSEVVGSRQPQKVKIMVTRKQLEVLVRNGKDFRINKIYPRSYWRRDGYRKWCPSLAGIQE